MWQKCRNGTLWSCEVKGQYVRKILTLPGTDSMLGQCSKKFEEAPIDTLQEMVPTKYQPIPWTDGRTDVVMTIPLWP